MISGIVLAAGQSRRMGSPKLLLPWHDRTVVEAVVGTLREGGVDRIIVVVGEDREAVERALGDGQVEFVVNPAFGRGEMLSSIQAGLAAIGGETLAALLTPGDLPSIQPATVRAVLGAGVGAPDRLCVPVYGGRRGHPVLIPRAHWRDLLALGEGESLRSYLRAREGEIIRVEVQDPGIRADIDTPADYDGAIKD